MTTRLYPMRRAGNVIHLIGLLVEATLFMLIVESIIDGSFNFGWLWAIPVLAIVHLLGSFARGSTFIREPGRTREEVWGRKFAEIADADVAHIYTYGTGFSRTVQVKSKDGGGCDVSIVFGVRQDDVFALYSDLINERPEINSKPHRPV